MAIDQSTADYEAEQEKREGLQGDTALSDRLQKTRSPTPQTHHHRPCALSA